MTVWGLVLGALATTAASAAATRLVLGWLRRRAILDLPNERSSHTLPVPRGGGLAVTPVIVAAWGAAAAMDAGVAQTWVWAALAAALLLLATSWLDDRYTLPAGPRFLSHILCVGGLLALLPADSLVFQGGVPVWADRLLTGIGWVWFINLYNFMDGIDGITGVQTVSLGVGVALIAGLAGISGLAPLAVAVAGAGLGFLVWNWHPARIFLGDSGSIPLGLLLGGLLVQLALSGQILAALILPAYYLADATITISRRALRGERIWQPHRQHFYQHAARMIGRHDLVSWAVAAINVALMAAAALCALGWAWAGLSLAVATVAAGLAWMASRRERTQVS